MNIKQAIENHLKSHSGLIALIGPNLFWRRFPQNVKEKALCINKISAPRETAMVKDPGVVYGRFQFTAMGPFTDGGQDEKNPDDILEQLQDALQDFTGIMGTSGENTGVQVDYTEYAGENEIQNDPEETGVYLNAADWLIDYHERGEQNG